MLAPASTLNSAILALPFTDSKIGGVTQFVNTICDYMEQVQGGALGSVGILTMNRSVMIAQFLTQNPVNDNSWINNFAEAWYEGVAQGTIAPGTVANPAWTTSAVDIATSSDPTVTITTLTSAKSQLESELASVSYSNNPALPFAEAIRDATLAFTFLCIGLGPLSVPIPISINAE